MYFRFLPRHVYYALLYRAVGTGESVGGQEGDLPLDFSRSVDPIPIRGANYAHHITTCPHKIFIPS